MTREEWLRSEIEKIKKRVELYQAMIAEWERELGSPVQTTNENSTSMKSKPEGSDGLLGRIRDYQFFNKSQPEAAKLVIEMAGHPLKTLQIMEAIEKGGLKVGGKNEKSKKQNFYTVLSRSQEVGLAGRDAWGLSSWPGVGKKAGKEEGVEGKVEKDNGQ